MGYIENGFTDRINSKFVVCVDSSHKGVSDEDSVLNIYFKDGEVMAHRATVLMKDGYFEKVIFKQADITHTDAFSLYKEIEFDKYEFRTSKDKSKPQIKVLVESLNDFIV